MRVETATYLDGSGKIWMALSGFDWIWADLVGFGWVWTSNFEWILKGFGLL